MSNEGAVKVNWQAFEHEAPALAAVGRAAFDRTGLVLVGTVRRDGWPCISPVEHMFIDGDLLLGMMWRSLKALDLLRDPKCVVHAAVSNPDGRSDPEFKLYGHARNVEDQRVREAYGNAWWAKGQWRPTEPYHLFALEIASAAYVRYDEGDMQHLETWPHGGARDVHRPS